MSLKVSKRLKRENGSALEICNQRMEAGSEQPTPDSHPTYLDLRPVFEVKNELVCSNTTKMKLLKATRNGLAAK